MHRLGKTTIRRWNTWVAKGVAAAFVLFLLVTAAKTCLPLGAPAIAVESVPCRSELIACSREQAARLRISNRGKAPLRLYEVRTACTATFSWEGLCSPCMLPLEIPPGQQVVLLVQFEDSRGSTADRGTVTVYSNDPRQPALTLEL